MRDQITVLRLASRDNSITEYCRRSLSIAINRRAEMVQIHQHGTVALESRNILANVMCGLNQCQPGVVFICDDDCLYHSSYFDRALDLTAYNYAKPGYYLYAHTFSRRFRTAMSSLAGDRDVLREGIWSRLRDRTFGEPGSRVEPGDGDGAPTVYQDLQVPYIDIRHAGNMTVRRRIYQDSKRAPHELPCWGLASELWEITHLE